MNEKKSSDKRYSNINSNANSDHETNQSAQLQPPVFQFKIEMAENEKVEEKEISQLKTNTLPTPPPSPPGQNNGNIPNNTGLPDQLKSGVENLSGFSLDGVKVHYNSAKPAQLQAHAYASGAEIHIGPGQEKHLPHETWHVVQQKQGRVKATSQFKSNTPINNDISLEKEADMMGSKATQLKSFSVREDPDKTNNLTHKIIQQKVIQRSVSFGQDFQKNHEVSELNVISAASKIRERNSPVNSVVKKSEIEKSSHFSEVMPGSGSYDFAVKPNIDVIKATKNNNKIKLEKYSTPTVEGYNVAKDKNVTHLGNSGVLKEQLGEQDWVDPAIAIAANAAAKLKQETEAAEQKSWIESKKLELNFAAKDQKRKEQIKNLISSKVNELGASTRDQKTYVHIICKNDGQALEVYNSIETILEGLTFEINAILTATKTKKISPQ